MMDEPPSEVTVTFSEPLDPSSVMTVLDECGNDVDSGPATVQLNEMRVGIAKTPSGMYKVVYRAVGVAGVTGTTGGNFEFMVHNGQPCKGGKKHHHDDDKKHDDHRDDRDDHDDHSEDDDHTGRDHDGHPGGGSGHSDHDTGSTDHGSDGHDMGSMDHGSGNTNEHHGGDHPRDREDPPLADVNQSLAAGPSVGPLRADGQAMLIGLALALAVGVLGGWLLRMTGNLVDAS